MSRLALIVLLLAGLTHARAQVFHDDVRLWSDAVTRAPHSVRAQLNLAASLMSSGQVTEALTHCQAAREAPHPTRLDQRMVRRLCLTRD